MRPTTLQVALVRDKEAAARAVQHNALECVVLYAMRPHKSEAQVQLARRPPPAPSTFVQQPLLGRGDGI